MTRNFSAVLLAGGNSIRMQRNKAFLEVEGVALWQRQLRILENLRPTEIFLAGPSRPEWKSANCIIVPDAQENAGPLAGLVAALRRSRTSLLLAFAVDLPHMTSVYLRGLLKLCQREIGVVPGARHRFEPLVAIYPKRSLAVAERFLANGSYSLQNFAASCTAHGLAKRHPIAPADAALFFNMNTPEDLAAAARRPSLPVRRGCDTTAPNHLSTSTPAASEDAASFG